MKTARITSITPDGEFDTAKGHMWAFIVAFDDGTEGQANSTRSTPPYRIGDSVGYEIKGQTPRGTNKLKIDRKFGQTAGAPAPQQGQTHQQQAPVQVGVVDERAFHNTMKKLCLAWCHCYVYAEKVEKRLAEAGHGVMTPDQKQALVASIWIAAKDAGLAQHPPALTAEPTQAPAPVQQPAPQPIHRTQQQNVSEAIPANGTSDDEEEVPF